MRAQQIAFLLGVVAAACGSDRRPFDSGLVDAAPVDASLVDAAGADAGTMDGGDCTTAGCPADLTCCASAATEAPTCVDLRTSSNHCGMCATGCGIMYECVDGTCELRE